MLEKSGTAVSRLQITLVAEPVSVPAARRFLADGLASWGLEELADDALLCLSELAGNAALHSSSAFMRVEVALLEDAVRVSVEDEGVVPVEALVPRPSFPDPDDGGDVVLDEEATTGRGLAIVSMLASQWGVDKTAGGKRVWFEITAAMPEHGVRAPRTDDADVAPQAPTALPDGWTRVCLVGCPVELSLRQDEHLDELVRELQLAGADRASDTSRAIAVELQDLLAGPAHARHMGRRTAQQAAAAGREHVDVEMVLPHEAGLGVERLQDVVRAADVHCQELRLLTLASSDDLTALRAWMTEEIVRQVRDGGPPVAWDDWLAARDA